MIPIGGLFESHLTVVDLQRSMAFFGGTLGLKLAEIFPERKAAFYWIGGRGKSMLGIWEVGSAPLRMSVHVAFNVDLQDLIAAPQRLQAVGITPLDFWLNPTGKPVVLAWMPAASLYFQDPDGNLLELLSMLPDPPRPDLGVVDWNAWNQRLEPIQARRQPAMVSRSGPPVVFNFPDFLPSWGNLVHTRPLLLGSRPRQKLMRSSPCVGSSCVGWQGRRLPAKESAHRVWNPSSSLVAGHSGR